MIKLGSIKKEREQRLISRITEGAGSFEKFIKDMKTYTERTTDSKLLDALEFAKQLKYDHPGLSPAAYLAHPLRVACLAMQIEPAVDTNTIIIALLHNALEVSNLKIGELKKRFNDNIVESILVLTVDRLREKEVTYIEAYYNKIYTLRSARIVKALDKLDNLFLLCLNQDENVRGNYLKEFERYVIPIIDRDLRDLSEYFRCLIKDCYEVGYLDANKSELINEKYILKEV